jgi:small subunit ribosomal protein S3
VQARHIFQSAALLAEYIARSLEQKKTVRAIWTRLLQEDTRSLKGLRILCAGRIGGAEMAKVESRRWGQAPLHSFAQPVDYSSATAHTPFGALGVKVWVCYRA